MKIKRDFFERDSVTVAKEILGTIFVHETKEGRVTGKIVETEAYGDATDLASHARFGVTERNKIMYGPAGILYVYLIYGIYNLTNIICEKEGRPSAVLIRAAEITNGSELAFKNILATKFAKANELLATGPGKFSAAFGINRTNNFTDLSDSQNFWLERGMRVPPDGIIVAKRVGVDYAGESKEKPWRFYLAGNIYASKR